MSGDKGWSNDFAILETYFNDERGLYFGKYALFVWPAMTGEVAANVKIYYEDDIAIVAQGGNTSLIGTGVRHDRGGEILLSLSRMNQARDIDPLNFTVTVEAGCILANLQPAAASEDRLFSLSLGEEGGCQVGGNMTPTPPLKR